MLIKPGQLRYVRWGKTGGLMKWTVEGLEDDRGQPTNLGLQDLDQVEQVLKVCQLVDSGIVAQVHANNLRLQKAGSQRSKQNGPNVVLAQAVPRGPLRQQD